MTRATLGFLIISVAALQARQALAELPADCQASIVVDHEKITGHVHPHVYGQFLEHIYHSVCDGLWGEQVRNRSFYDEIDWSIVGDVVRQRSFKTPSQVRMGDAAWTDCELTLQARKVGGREGFLIMVRCRDEKNWCWWNLGGWGNVKHALEICRAGKKRIVGPAPVGQIKTDHWYDIRIRLEGDRVVGWLDGEKLLDVGDVPHRAGRIGLATWSTQADFRSVVVKDLAGTVLFTGLPKLPRTAVAPANWRVYHEGPTPPKLSMVKNHGANTGRAIRIDPTDSSWQGLAQDRFYVQKGLTYTGDVWVRAPAFEGELKVELRSPDGGVLAGQRLRPEGVEKPAPYYPMTFRLRPTRTEENASLIVAGKGAAPWQIDFVSMMSSAAKANGGFRPDLLAAVKALEPPIIRWPGGCFASIYRWKRSIGPQPQRKPFYNRPWGYWDSGCFGIDEFVRLCRVVGAEPLVVLNLGSWDSPDVWKTYLTEALEWVEYCNGSTATPMGKLRAANGHPAPYNVTHWELDNETWGMKVDGYVDRLKPFVAEIRRRWPDVILYACTFWEKEDPHLLKRAAKDFDLISYHFYHKPQDFAVGPRKYEAIWRRYVPMIANSANPKIKLGITEWNAQSTDWRTGLFAAGILNVYERLDVVQMATPALFIRRTDATAWDNAFINHDHVRWYPAPNYVVMKLYREHYQPKRVQHDVVGALDVMATASEDGKTLVLKIVNATHDAIKAHIDLGTFKPKSATAWLVTAKDVKQRNTLDRPDHIAPKRAALTTSGTSLTQAFPPISVTVIEAR